MLALLAKVVNIDSGSYGKAGVDAVGGRFADVFNERGLPGTWPHHLLGAGRRLRRLHSISALRRRTNEGPIVLLGHRDTVFPKGEAGRRPFHIEAGRATPEEYLELASLVPRAQALAPAILRLPRPAS